MTTRRTFLRWAAVAGLTAATPVAAVGGYAWVRAGRGASGFLLKNAAPADLRPAIAVVADGQALLDPAVTRRVIERHTRPAGATPLRGLTARELEVAQLIAAGLTNDEISRELQVSGWTVKTHVRHILTKLGARDRVQVVIAVYQAGLA